MRFIFWLLFCVTLILPLLTYLVYYYRRLGTRRKLLLQTILSLGLDDTYMRMRHGQKYDAWKKSHPLAKRIENFERFYFNEDFRAGTSHKDYAWPVALFIIVTGIGWFLTLHRIYPSFTDLTELRDFLPNAFVYGFVGAFLACVLTLFDEFRQYNLEPSLYNSLTYRILFASTAAYIAGKAVDVSFIPLVAFGIGLFPIQSTWEFITERTAQAVGAARPEERLGLELAKIQGLEHSRNRQKLLDINVSTIQALATSDPLLLFFQTTFPLRTIIDFIDKAILYLYLGDKVGELRQHGINGVIELVAIGRLADKIPAYNNLNNPDTSEEAITLFKGIDVNNLITDLTAVTKQTPNELKALIYNLYYDPLVKFIYDIWGRCLNLDQRLNLKEGEIEVEKEYGEGAQTAGQLNPAG